MSTEASTSPTAACPQHPAVAAQFTCARCNTGVCVDCCYTMPDGSICCKTCLSDITEPVAEAAPVPAPPVEPAKPKLSLRMSSSESYTPSHSVAPVVAAPGKGCVQHPTVPAVAKCKVCGANSCHTCNFVFDTRNLCPVCASTAGGKLSPRRKMYLITAYVMAGLSTLCVFVAIALAFGGTRTEASETLLGLVVMAVTWLPCTIGTAMAWSAMRKGGNTIAIWIALIWNCLGLAGIVLLVVLGMFMK